MREWSSGAQTDFTNYAARRLSERGLLREEDPIKLQRAVTDIAYSYARGGNVGAPVHLRGWPEATLREDFGQASIAVDADTVRDQSANDDAAVRERQTTHGVQ